MGAICVVLLRPAAELQLLPVAFGTVAVITGSLTALLPDSAVAIAALTVAIVGTFANALPWLALSSTRIRVISPQTDAEVFDAPPPIDVAAVRRRTAGGQRLLLALRLALGLVLLGGVLPVAAASPVGALLCALAFVGMTFQSRQILSRSGVLAVMVLGAIGLAATGLVATAAHPDLRPPAAHRAARRDRRPGDRDAPQSPCPSSPEFGRRHRRDCWCSPRCCRLGVVAAGLV